jgi:hypothetical protein
MRPWTLIAALGLLFVIAARVDPGPVVDAPVTTITATVEFVNPGCFEDEVIAQVKAGWTGTHFERSPLMFICVPSDDIDRGRTYPASP